MSEKETEKKIDIKTVKKEIEKISVIDSTNVNKITLQTSQVKQLLKDFGLQNLKPCIFFPDQQKMIVFDM